MASPRETTIPMQATEYFREVEAMLRDLGFVEERISQAILLLAKEYRADFRKTRLILNPRYCDGDTSPRALYWAVLTLARKKLQEQRQPERMNHKKGLKVHLPRKKLDHDFIYEIAKEAAREALIMEYDRRAFALNAAYRRVRNAIMSIESILLARGDRRRWEGGDLQVDAPQISTDLRPRSRNALGAGWFYLLRSTVLEFELISLAERYNAEPVYDGLRLCFARDADHPYGRVYWLHCFGRLPRRKPSERAREHLTDKVMRQLHLGESVRRQLSRHERHRRRMCRLHQQYTEVLGRVKRIGRTALAAGDEGLLDAHPRQAEAG